MKLTKIELTAVNSKGETVTDYKKIGTTGKSIAIKSIALEDEKQEYTFLYRVYLRKIGWTKFAKAGQLCGISDISEKLNSIVIEGIQIICMYHSDRLTTAENITDEAEQKLAEYEKICNGLFVTNHCKMLEAATREYIKKESLKVLEVTNGGVLPLRKD